MGYGGWHASLGNRVPRVQEVSAATRTGGIIATPGVQSWKSGFHGPQSLEEQISEIELGNAVRKMISPS